MGVARVAVRTILVFIVAALLIAASSPGQSQRAAASPSAPSDCRDTVITTSPWWSHAPIRARWERALAVANHTCLMAPDGPSWDCSYAETLPSLDQRLCFYPVPNDLLAGAPNHLGVLVDLRALHALAERALVLPDVQRLLGSGGATIDVVVENQRARFVTEGFAILQESLTALPPLCTPFDTAELGSVLSAERHARWDDNSARTLGVCAARGAPPPGQCQAIDRAPGDASYLCWWGLRENASPDYRFDVAPDALRAILNADDAAPVAKAALKRGAITIWSADPFKRATLRLALDTLVGDPGDLRPPVGDPGTIAFFGRTWHVVYFPRDGLLTPCARDDQGTWYWLNDLGVPNGFVGPSTIMGMKRFLALHGDAPSEADVLHDLYVTYQPNATVDDHGTQLLVEYVFVPGSPFSLLPVAKRHDGTFVHLNGDGSIGDPIPPSGTPAMDARVAAARLVGSQVDFHTQPGTLSQDLKFLAYAIDHNPAAPQIASLLESLGNGTRPDPSDVAGLFPPESPRIALGERFGHPNVGSAVADGDAYVLGMATHQLLWTDLVRYGAIEPSPLEAPS